MPPKISSRARYLGDPGKQVEAPGLCIKPAPPPAGCGQRRRSRRRGLEAGRRCGAHFESKQQRGGAGRGSDHRAAPRARARHPRCEESEPRRGVAGRTRRRRSQPQNLGALGPDCALEAGRGRGFGKIDGTGRQSGAAPPRVWFEIPRRPNGSRSGDWDFSGGTGWLLLSVPREVVRGPRRPVLRASIMRRR